MEFFSWKFVANRKFSDRLVKEYELRRCTLVWLGLVCVLSMGWLWPRADFWLELQRRGSTSNWVASWALCIHLHLELRLIGEYETILVKIIASPNENIYTFLISTKKEGLFPSEHLWNTKYCFTKSGKWLYKKKMLILAKKRKNHYINCLQHGFVLSHYTENIQ